MRRTGERSGKAGDTDKGRKHGTANKRPASRAGLAANAKAMATETRFNIKSAIDPTSASGKAADLELAVKDAANTKGEH